MDGSGGGGKPLITTWRTLASCNAQSIAARMAEPEHWREAKNAVIGAESKAFSPTPLNSVSPRWTSHGMAAWIITAPISDCCDCISTIFLGCFPGVRDNNLRHPRPPRPTPV